MVIKIDSNMVQSGRNLICKCIGYGAKIDYKEETEFTTYTIKYKDTLCRDELDFLEECGISKKYHTRYTIDLLAQQMSKQVLIDYAKEEKQ